MSRTIPLTRGYVTVVDDEDYQWLSKYQWRAIGTKWVYAATEIPEVVGKTGKPKPVLMHRLVLGLLDTPRSEYGDHVDGDTLNNRRFNLRITDNKGNQGNRHRPHSDRSTSKYRGVYWNKQIKKWVSRIKVDRVLYHVGNFESERDAAVAYDVAARLHFGEQVQLNLPEERESHVFYYVQKYAQKTKPRPGSSIVPGVSYRPGKGKWSVYAYEGSRQIHLGWCDTEEEAVVVRIRYEQAGQQPSAS